MKNWSQVVERCERCNSKAKLYEWNYCGPCLRELTRGGHNIDKK